MSEMKDFVKTTAENWYSIPTVSEASVENKIVKMQLSRRYMFEIKATVYLTIETLSELACFFLSVNS